jgi:hypothetical protein
LHRVEKMVQLRRDQLGLVGLVPHAVSEHFEQDAERDRDLNAGRFRSQLIHDLLLQIVDDLDLVRDHLRLSQAMTRSMFDR